MATSPPAHTNPPHNPKKRPSTSALTSTPQPTTGSKRPKHTHPLRQTSFVTPGSKTPSESGSTTSKMANKRNRGRPKKQPSLAALSPTAAPIPNTLTTTTHPPPTARATTTAPRSTATDDPPPPSEDEMDLPDTLPLSTEADLATERAHLATLQDALSVDQAARYTVYKNTSLKSAPLKRIINQVVSQSVTNVPLQSVRWVSKVFLGEVIEGARRVQKEWAEGWDAARKTQEQELKAQAARAVLGQKTNQDDGEDANDDDEEAKTTAAATADTTSLPPQPKAHILPTATPAPNPTLLTPPYTPSSSFPHPQSFYGATANPHRGGLLPEHLREAVRRARAAGEYGGVGSGGWSHGGLGVRGEHVGGGGLGRESGRGGLFR